LTNIKKNVIVQLWCTCNNRVLFNVEHVRTYSMESFERKNTFFRTQDVSFVLHLSSSSRSLLVNFIQSFHGVKHVLFSSSSVSRTISSCVATLHITICFFSIAVLSQISKNFVRLIPDYIDKHVAFVGTKRCNNSLEGKNHARLSGKFIRS